MLLKKILQSFMRGLLVLAPIAITFWLIWKIVSLLDGWLHVPVPGLGLLISFVAITVIGHLAGNVMGKRFIAAVDELLERVPFVKLLYSSLRDLFKAFVGEQRTFKKPVVVDLGGDVRAFGFVTCERFDDPQMTNYVSVYMPQSYNFAGNLVSVPRQRVHALDADGAQFMAFIMSGGVTDMQGARTVIDDSLQDKTERMKK